MDYDVYSRVRVALASGRDVVDLASHETASLDSVGVQAGGAGTLADLGLILGGRALDGRSLGEGGNAAESDENRLEHHLEGGEGVVVKKGRD